MKRRGIEDKKQLTCADLRQVRIGGVILIAAACIGWLEGVGWVGFIVTGIALLWMLILKGRYRD